MTARSVSAVVPAPAGRPDDDAADHRIERRFTFFGTVATYAAAAIPIVDLAARSTVHGAGAWVAMGGLLVAFFLLYHLHFLRGPDQPALARVVRYGAVQSLIVIALQRLEPSFVGLAIALTIQIMSVLPPRLWPIPVVALVASQAAAWDLITSVRRGDAAETVLFVYELLLWVSTFGFVIALLRQRARLANLVGELRRAEDALRRAAAQAEELATLRERTRLAREMHDGLGHALVTVNVKLEAAERLYRRDADRGAAELRATRDLVREAMVGLRRSLDDLRAPLVSPPDLPAALRTLLAETRERTGLAIVDEIDPAVTEAAPEVAEACWWLAREALRNAERHAAAGCVAVALIRRSDALVLRVADDGTGIAAGDQARPGRHGIVGMRERAAALGGSLRVDRRPGGGTVVEALLPLPTVTAGVATPSPAVAPAENGR